MYAKKNKTLKALVAVLSMVLVMCLSVAGTLTYLQDMTEPVINTFSPSNIGLTLTETNVDGDSVTANTYKMVPGVDIVKDPKVTVLANSEACWLFVKVDTANDVAKFLDYSIDTGWQLVPNTENVYYKQHEATGNSDGTPISVLTGDKVTVKNTVTKGDMSALYNEDGTVKTNALPKLTFTAYAVQQEGFTTAEAAWAEAKGAASNP